MAVVMNKYNLTWEIDWPAEQSLQAIESLKAEKGLIKSEALDEAVVTIKRHSMDQSVYSVRLQFEQEAESEVLAVAKVSTRYFRLNNFLEETEFLIRESCCSKYRRVEVSPE